VSIPANKQLADIIRQLGECTARVHRYLEVDEQRFRRPPRGNAWSAAQCVRHLSLTTDAYLKIMDDALGQADQRSVGREHRYRPDLIGRFLAWLLEPPFRSKTKTAKPFEPIAIGSQAAVVGEFEERQQALVARVQRCDGRDLERLKVVSPFNASAKYNLYSALIILTAHQRRHLWQADQALGQS
jgi:hypothetical protein